MNTLPHDRMNHEWLIQALLHDPPSHTRYQHTVPVLLYHPSIFSDELTCSSVLTETPRIREGPSRRRTSAAGRSSCEQ